MYLILLDANLANKYQYSPDDMLNCVAMFFLCSGWMSCVSCIVLNRKSLPSMRAEKRFSSLCKENIEVAILILVLACFLVFLEQFFLNIARNELVACELHRERCASTGD